MASIIDLQREKYEAALLEARQFGYCEGYPDGYRDGVKDTRNHYKSIVSHALRGGSSAAGKEMNQYKKQPFDSKAWCAVQKLFDDI